MAADIHIVPTPEGACSVCKKVEELRPYGKDGAWVCYECGMKDPENARKQFEKQFLKNLKPGDKIVIGMPVIKQPKKDA